MGKGAVSYTHLDVYKRQLVLSPDSWEEGYDDIVIAGDDHTVEFVGSVVWFQASGELE